MWLVACGEPAPPDASVDAGPPAAIVDPSFGRDGYTQLDIRGEQVAAIAVRPSGAFAAITYSFPYNGELTSRLRVFLDDGSLDPVFASSGVLALDAFRAPHTVLAAADGRWTVIGPCRATPALCVMRWNPDRTPDASFGDNGLVTVDGVGYVDAAVTADGGAIVIGTTAAARLTPDGVLDTTYGDAGHAALPFETRHATIDGAGRVLAVEYGVTTTVTRLTADGAVDATYGASGLAAGSGNTGLSTIVALDDGAVLVGGTYFQDLLVLRFDADGSPSPDFAQYGRAVLAEGSNAFGIAVLPDGRIAAAGYHGVAGIIDWIGSDGRWLDTSLTPNAIWKAIGTDAQGRVIVGGDVSLVPGSNSYDGVKFARFLPQ